MGRWEGRPWFKSTESDREVYKGTMSRIHEALKRDAQERSTQVAAGWAAPIAEVAGEIRRSDMATTIVNVPAAPSPAVAADKKAVPLRYEELVMRCSHPEWC